MSRCWRDGTVFTTSNRLVSTNLLCSEAYWMKGWHDIAAGAEAKSVQGLLEKRARWQQIFVHPTRLINRTVANITQSSMEQSFERCIQSQSIQTNYEITLFCQMAFLFSRLPADLLVHILQGWIGEYVADYQLIKTVGSHAAIGPIEPHTSHWSVIRSFGAATDLYLATLATNMT